MGRLPCTGRRAVVRLADSPSGGADRTVTVRALHAALLVTDRLPVGAAAPSSGLCRFLRSPADAVRAALQPHRALERAQQSDRKSVVSGKSVTVRVDIGGRRIIKQKKKNT